MAHSCAPARAECRLSSSLEPGLLLAPLRLEPVCEEPGLLIIHDLLSDKEVRAMKTNALKRYTPTALSIIIDVMFNISTISLQS